MASSSSITYLNTQLVNLSTEDVKIRMNTLLVKETSGSSSDEYVAVSFRVNRSFKDVYFNADMNQTFQECTLLNYVLGEYRTGDVRYIGNWEYVENMYYTFYNCSNLRGNPVCGTYTIDMNKTYYNCRSLTGSPVCGTDVTNMGGTYLNCANLTGSPVCGKSVTNFAQAYEGCRSLNGQPVCGTKVTNMYHAYLNCTNMVGRPVFGPNVTNIRAAYGHCYNLIGSPVCRDDFVDMTELYAYCNNLTGNPVCGNNTTTLKDTYRNCTNLAGVMYLNYNGSDDVTAKNCFTGKDVLTPLYLVVKENSVWNTWLFGAGCSSTNSIVGAAFTWTHNTDGYYYFNTAYNLYVYYNNQHLPDFGTYGYMNWFNIPSTSTSITFTRG